MIRATSGLRKSAPFVLLLALGLTLSTGCRVQQTEEGKMPDVDVEVKGGNVPEYDVDAADVDVNAKETEVTVPDVDVKTEKKKVTVPDVDVTMPSEKPADDNDPPK
jgi:hypothetical protein